MQLGDPLGIARRGVGLYLKGLRVAERAALQVLSARMDDLAPRELPPSERSGATPAELMSELLEESLAQDPGKSRDAVHLALLRQLVPDEARILAALADGQPAPLLHVYPRKGGEVILANASLVGRMAATTLPGSTPEYVGRLLSLGLVETGPEDPDNANGYELLMADRDVRAALAEGSMGKLAARTERRTLRLSARGRELWDACRP